MDPILLIHGYSSEGKNNSASEIYGSLPDELRRRFGADVVKEINLSRWISLNDGIRLDDVTLAMNRALTSEYPQLLQSGFHVIIHSTGALVVRNWIRTFCQPKTFSPIHNLIHLAGVNFGSGLAHVGQGQLARWGRLIFQGTGRGLRVLNELEFGSWKTLDLHLHFLQSGHDMYDDYGVQEFVVAGSQTLPFLRPVPIRYVKEDSADNTVRTSAANLNFNYRSIRPTNDYESHSVETLHDLLERRFEGNSLGRTTHSVESEHLAKDRREIPFAIAYETAHFGGDIGIVSGKKNRNAVMPLIQAALKTPHNPESYAATVAFFHDVTAKTYTAVSRLKNTITDWNRQQQYEAHAQIIFRIKDQFGNGVEHFDITFKSMPNQADSAKLETLIEDTHKNKQHPGTITFYLRTQKYDSKKKRWANLLEQAAPLHIEITGSEPLSSDIAFVPMTVTLKAAEVCDLVANFRTTVIDVTLARLPSSKVFGIVFDPHLPGLS